MKRILLVEPSFPYPNKSKNKASSIHKNFVPIGLLKLASLCKAHGDKVKLVRGQVNKNDIGFIPDEVWVTSLFTYWSRFVWESIAYYRSIFPFAEMRLGGIYATLHCETEKFRLFAKSYKVEVHRGIHKEAEKYLPDYSLIPEVEYHATHMMRGCIRKCPFCGTWIIEPERTNKSKDEILGELKCVSKNKVIFYDNNILANPHIEEILQEFSDLRINDKPVQFESQSGFDGRLLEKKTHLAQLIKKARFQNVRIAWDNGLEDRDSIREQLDLLSEAGYKTKDVSVFMIYNFNVSYENMLEKIKFCKKWGVQIADCRYRPLNLDYDEYNPHLKGEQLLGSYYIHELAGWTDQKIRDFRRRVRIHNIWIRYAKDKGLEYDRKMERWSAINNTYKFFNLGRPPQMEQIEQSAYLQKKIRLLRKIRSQLGKDILFDQFNFGSVKDIEEYIEKNLKTGFDNNK